MMFFGSKKYLYILLLGAIIIGSAVFCSRVFSYNDTITHPSLTDNVARIYNNNFEIKLDTQEIGWLKQGSTEEDAVPRWMNHFYNSDKNEGLWNFSTAKSWSQNPALQAAYFINHGNQSWQKAIDSYAAGDNKSAFIALGHTLHLLEDMTVPAHTRLDPHPSVKEYEDLLTANSGSQVGGFLKSANIDSHLSGDPYEAWVNNKGALFVDVKAPVCLDSLDKYFDALAGYSSQYFFSKNTTDIGSFKNLKKELISENDKAFDCLVSSDGNNKFCLAVVDKNFVNPGKVEYQLINRVHSDYFNLLAPKAVAYGAGVVKLFFDEAEKKKKEEENKNWWQKIKEKAGGILASLSGSLYAGISTSEIAPSEARPSEAPEESPATTEPVKYSLPINVVEARDKIVAPLPSNTVEAREKLGGNLAEETNPQDKKVPANIKEETDPSKVPLPSVSPGPGSSSGGGSSSSGSSSDTTPPETTIASGPAATEATTTATFEFTSSESGSTFSCQLDSATSTSCASPKEYTGLSEGSHTFKVSATDASGNVDATPAEDTWAINLAPEVSVSLSDYSMLNINFTVNWTSSASDVSSYDAQYKINSSGAWTDWAMATTTVAKSFEAGQDNGIYYFRVRANDSVGNQSDWQEVSAPISLKPIIFNEIMYDPNPGSDSYYEYVELYNRAPAAIDLAGWQFVAGGTTHTISADTIHGGSSTSLASGGYALLVDKVTSTTTASVYDGYYSVPAYSTSALRLRVSDATLNLSNTGATLTLKNASSTTIDEVVYDSVWGANNNGKSLERINYNNIYSQNQSAWTASAVGGTPNAVNGALDVSAGTLVADNVAISQNTIWTKAGSPYLLYSNSGAYPTLNAGVKLIVEPGATLKPQNKNYYALYVRGTLKAEGSASDKIVFTSKEASPKTGDWGTAIYFASDSTNSTLSYVNFEYGGYQPAWPNSAQPAVVVSGSKVIFDNCLFSNSQTRALDLIGSSSTVQNSQFASSTSAAIYISGVSAPTITGNTFQNSGHVGTAIKMDSSASPSVQSNTIAGFEYAIWLQSAYPSFSGNNLSDNSYNGVYVDDHTVIAQNTTWQSSLVWLLMSNSGHYSTVATGTTLTLESGATLKPLNKYYTALKIEGSLMADGNSSSTLINFTSFKDDSLGGDSNNDGSLTSATSTVGDWKDLWLTSGSQTTLKFVQFQYGGYQSGGWREAAKSLKEDSGAVVVKENVTVN